MRRNVKHLLIKMLEEVSGQTIHAAIITSKAYKYPPVLPGTLTSRVTVTEAEAEAEAEAEGGQRSASLSC